MGGSRLPGWGWLLDDFSRQLCVSCCLWNEPSFSSKGWNKALRCLRITFFKACFGKPWVWKMMKMEQVLGQAWALLTDSALISLLCSISLVCEINFMKKKNKEHCYTHIHTHACTEQTCVQRKAKKGSWTASKALELVCNLTLCY